jgi:hypothetical protein
MRYLVIVVFIFIANWSQAQSNLLVNNKNVFDKELKLWTATFKQFRLTDFKISDTSQFDNNNSQDFGTYQSFLNIYKPIMSFSSDNTQFIDLYSHQLNLEKRGKYYQATVEVDQAIYLCNKEKKYWDRISFFTTSSSWIDEVVWISKKEFLLVGITKSDDDKKMPLILLGNTDSQTLLTFVTKNERCIQNKNGYKSPQLKKMKIKGL